MLQKSNVVLFLKIESEQSDERRRKDVELCCPKPSRSFGIVIKEDHVGRFANLPTSHLSAKP